MSALHRAKDDRLKDHPLMVHFGALCNPLTNDEAHAADFETRINSIGRFLVREVLGFCRKLSPQGRANFDPEDILLECWIELRKRNDKYDPSLGGYRTFANTIIQHVFLGISERARTVKLPANSAPRLKKAADASKDGKDTHQGLTPLTRAARDQSDIAPHVPLLQDRRPSPIDGLIWLEDFERINSDIAECLSDLDTYECIAIGINMRLWGGDKQSLQEAATKYGVEPIVLRRALKSAREKLVDGIYSSLEVSDDRQSD